LYAVVGAKSRLHQQLDPAPNRPTRDCRIIAKPQILACAVSSDEDSPGDPLPGHAGCGGHLLYKCPFPPGPKEFRGVFQRGNN
jgi:hypothetical protein